jgi:16S rRNA G966 N2-methylase RsmD
MAPASTGFHVRHQLNRQIPPEPHTHMYVWHKYWSRKTWNVVGEFIETYTKPGEVVFDPFAGSGVVAVEAVRRGRRAIVCDLNPAASLITDITLRSVDIAALEQAFRRVEKGVREKIDALYEIHCVKCNKPLVCYAFVREGNALKQVRYPRCPNCGHRAEHATPHAKDVKHLEELESNPVRGWYPKNELSYPDGSPFKEKQRYNSLAELFTRRNLQAAVWLYEEIEREPNPKLRQFLHAAFSSMIHLCTRMMPVGTPQETNHYTFFSSPGWTQHSYWSAARYMEQSVWDKFASALTGGQGLLKAKQESEQELPNVKVTSNWRKVLDESADVAIITGDCLKLMRQMPEDSVHYIFTDPPYDSSVQYGELSLLWNAWQKADTNYTEELLKSEIIHNERQHKNFDVYYGLLSSAFRACHRILKPARYLTLTFHNPTFKVRNATVRAGVFAGFDYQKIHHQPLGQVSAKSMIQPFGSAQGDFYLRFYKSAELAKADMEEVTEDRFRKIVIDACRQVIAERAEPTPYTILLNYVDPILAKHGLFATLKTGLDVKKVLQEALATDFTLMRAKMGGATGKLWWFKDATFAQRLKEVPLSERVEQTVFRVLQDKARVTFTDVWDAVSREFPNSLTSDSTSIKEALERYGRKITGAGGYWMLRDEIRDRIRAHAEIIAILAHIGRARGYDIWIAKNEQATVAEGVVGHEKLASLVTTTPRSLTAVSNLKDVLLMDLLWLDGSEVECAFEIESTTTMTSALQRGSNLPEATPKIMVLPEERNSDFERKMQSPLFGECFDTQNWKLLFFDALRAEYLQSKTKTDIGSLLGVQAKAEKKKLHEQAPAAQEHFAFG